jgi:hypothetical protein
MHKKKYLHYIMRLPLELEHLIKTGTTTSSTRATENTITSKLLAVEEGRALEVDHYLRACALRLGLVAQK